jgi:hypothetical protein
VRDNADALLTVPAQVDALDRHDVFLRAGPRVTAFLGSVNIDAQYFNEYEFNRYSVTRNDVRNQRFDVRAELRLP